MAINLSYLPASQGAGFSLFKLQCIYILAPKRAEQDLKTGSIEKKIGNKRIKASCKETACFRNGCQPRIPVLQYFLRRVGIVREVS